MDAKSPSADRRLLELSDAAERLGVSTITIRRWAAAGRLRLYRVGPRKLRVDAAELDALITIVPTARAGE